MLKEPLTADLPVIPRARGQQALGGDITGTIFTQAETAGVVKLHRSPTGREFITPRQFEALFKFAARARDDE
jgi:hypothetical protein